MTEGTSSGGGGDTTTATTAVDVVVVQPLAYVSAALHAATYPNDVVHGVLLGRRAEEGTGTGKTAGTVLLVTDAVPVSHGIPPTKPVAEMALALIETSLALSSSSPSGYSPSSSSSKIAVVGWYTSPALLDDAKPGPVALRMAASLSTRTATVGKEITIDPVLLVVQNVALGRAVAKKNDDDETDDDGAHPPQGDVFAAYGKEPIGKQWVQPLTVQLEDTSKSVRALREALHTQKLKAADFVQHLENGNDSEDSDEWYPDKRISYVVENCCDSI